MPTASAHETALLLVGFQNDYFDPDGALHGVVEAGVHENAVLDNTLALLRSAAASDCLAIQLPILFSSDYSELQNPVGLLATVREAGAFRRGTRGGRVVDGMAALGDRVEHREGKTGFNAFLGTGLEARLRGAGIRRVCLCGVVTSVCIDSTGRAAAEAGFEVTVLTDCISGRTRAEDEFYRENVFPLYAKVESSVEFLTRLKPGQAA